MYVSICFGVYVWLDLTILSFICPRVWKCVCGGGGGGSVMMAVFPPKALGNLLGYMAS